MKTAENPPFAARRAPRAWSCRRTTDPKSSQKEAQRERSPLDLPIDL
jgi:hypothetical protein